MTERWLGYSAPSERGELARALRSINPHASVAFAHNAEELREMVLGHNRGRIGVIVGLTHAGVSDVNLAAALARDGVASEVVLVARGPSGSLKSRALSAGVSDVIDVALVPRTGAKASVPAGLDEPDLPSEEVPTTLATPHVPRPSVVPEVEPERRGQGSRPGHGRPAGPGRHGQHAAPADRVTRERQAPRTSGGQHQGAPWSGQWHVVEDEPPAAGELPRRVDAAREGSAAGSGASVRGASVTSGALPGEGRPPARGSSSDGEAFRPGERGVVLSFVSGRGGVGKTSLVALFGAVASSWGMGVALCDLDLTCGNLYSCFGLAHGADLGQLCAQGAPGVAELQRAGQPAGGGMRLWGPCSQPEMAEVAMPRSAGVINALASRFDLVLVDTSTTFTDAVAQAAQTADRLLLVSDGGPGTEVALARLGSLAVRLGVARTRIVRLSNRCDPKGTDEVMLNRANVGLETARTFRVLEGGDELSELLAAGRAVDVPDAMPELAASAASALAKVLSEMGRLPSSEAAEQAARDEGRRRRRLFGRKRRAS